MRIYSLRLPLAREAFPLGNMRVPKGSMISKYGTSTCNYCYDRIRVGDVIRNGDKGWGHHKCVAHIQAEEKKIAKLDENADIANNRRWKTA
jgi:hypothetical protein